MSDPAISIVLTTFNGEKYLAEQLDSIIHQTCKNLEIIICDDASTDQTVNILQGYAASDERIVLVLQEKNIGLHDNLSAGLSMAKGDFIAISDQDDIWRADKIEKLLGCMGDHAASFSDSELINAEGNLSGKTVMHAIGVQDVTTALRPLRLLRKNVVSGHALLFHRSLLSHALPFSPGLIFDHQLAIVASLHGGLAYFPEPLVKHRIHGNNRNNAVLLDLDSLATTPLQEPRWERRRHRRNTMLANLQFVLSNGATINHSNSDLFRDLHKIAAVMSADPFGFFDFRLFMALSRFDKKYHFFGTRQRIKLCKGPFWYHLADKMGGR